MTRFSTPLRGAFVLSLAALHLACSEPKQNELCTPDDADGVIGEAISLLLTVTDREFAPKILAAQNVSEVTLRFENHGTRPHGFVVDCLPTPNSDGCPTESCFASASKIEPVAPGQFATVVFETPLVEGIYYFRSDLREDSELMSGQFIIQ
jgi:hypothetical protein